LKLWLDQFIIKETEDNLQNAEYLLYSVSKEYNLEIATKKTKVFAFIGPDHLRTRIIINDEALEQVSHLTYFSWIITYQFSIDVEFKLAKFLKFIGAIFWKFRNETILKVYKNLVLPTFYMGQKIGL